MARGSTNTKEVTSAGRILSASREHRKISGRPAGRGLGLELFIFVLILILVRLKQAKRRQGGNTRESYFVK